jgi:hypothetical protein
MMTGGLADIRIKKVFSQRIMCSSESRPDVVPSVTLRSFSEMSGVHLDLLVALPPRLDSLHHQYSSFTEHSLFYPELNLSEK